VLVAADSGKRKSMEAYARFHRTTDEVPAAREFVRDTMVRGGWGDSAAVADAVLVVSELFTNAVQHGSGWVDVDVVVNGDAVRIAVVDDGKGQAVMVPEPLPITKLSGRGLRIVDALTSEWGNSQDPAGRNRVWAELPRS
jgi:anti-sigma regulatory factor (Ser/Thr protein kinase)